MRKLTIRRADDMHLHLRDNDYLATTVPMAARSFARAIVMPNLSTPITSIEAVDAYYQRILAQIPAGQSFAPLMTLYLTDETTPSLIEAAASHPHIFAAKLYPAGATTNSANGVTDVKHIYPALAQMEAQDMPLLIHGETTDVSVDVFDREKVFIEETLQPIIKQFPKLRIVLEHITTSNAVDFILAQKDNVAATITVHHLLLNRNDLLVGGIKPHHYCLPIVKRATHQQALLNAAIRGNQKFFLGTDSAPHTQHSKESACGCAGIFTSHCALELITQIFDTHNALDKLEAFTSTHGANFYQLPINAEKTTLIEETWRVPENYSFGNDTLIPFLAGKDITWKIQP